LSPAEVRVGRRSGVVVFHVTHGGTPNKILRFAQDDSREQPVLETN